MLVEDIYFIGLHYTYFRCGIPALVIGIKMVTPNATTLQQRVKKGIVVVGMAEYHPRLCYHVRFSDGKEDYFPLEQTDTYKVLTFDEMIKHMKEVI